MPLKVFLAANLRKYVPGYDPSSGYEMSIEPGEAVSEVATRLGIPLDAVRIIMVEGRSANWDLVLRGDERVAFFPPVGGG
jgi:sulfur-carrier protein